MTHQRVLRSVALLSCMALSALASCSTAPAPASGPTPAANGAGPSTRSTTATIKDSDGKTMAQLFQNKFAGVNVYQVPGGGIRVLVRNAGGIDGNGDPLYVVDGVQVATPDGTLYIDPNNITKIEVIKDAGQLALYGNQGVNGVVKITTKK